MVNYHRDNSEIYNMHMTLDKPPSSANIHPRFSSTLGLGLNTYEKGEAKGEVKLSVQVLHVTCCALCMQIGCMTY